MGKTLKKYDINKKLDFFRKSDPHSQYCCRGSVEETYIRIFSKPLGNLITTLQSKVSLVVAVIRGLRKNEKIG